MAGHKFILQVVGYPDISCELTTTPRLLTSREVISSHGVVFADLPYQFQIEFSDIQQDNNPYVISLEINGKPINFEQHHENGVCCLTPRAGYEERTYGVYKPFLDNFGFVQLSICIRNNENEDVFYTPFFEVLLRDNERTEDLKAMAEYVVQRRDLLLVKSDKVPATNRNLYRYSNTEKDDLSGICELLESCVHIYELHLSYFTSYCRTKLIQVQQKDSFEKLKSFDSHTMQYVLQHPEELVPCDYETAIKYAHRSYLPMHTLVTHSRTSKETYENSVILNFLPHLIDSVRSLLNQMENDLISATHMKVIPGYVSSIEAILKTVVSKYRLLEERLRLIEQKLTHLYRCYSRILPLPKQKLINIPKPTQVFLRVPVYRIFYDKIAQWFTIPEYNLEKEQAIFTFLLNSRLYEYYVLVSEIERLQGHGFLLDHSKHFDYKGIGRMSFYQDIDYANTFVFKNGQVVATLYFQPVIYGKSIINDNDLGLRRITKLSWRDRSYGGDYYLPDYVLKVNFGDEVEYTVIDAKYSTFENVRDRYASELAFKYLLSLRAIKEHEKIRGLLVYYGKRSEQYPNSYSFWNLLNSRDQEEFAPTFNAESRFAPQIEK